MRILAVIGVLAVAARAQESFLDKVQVLTSSKEVLNLEHAKDLGCGGCLRSGFTFCGERNWDSSDDPVANATCCKNDDLECIERFTKHSLLGICVTMNEELKITHKTTTIFFKDPLVGAQMACGKIQNNTACCGKRSDAERFGRQHGLGDDDLCEFRLNNTRDSFNVSLDLENVPYGTSCTMEVKAKCGYPNFVLNNTNIDMIVAFKKNMWGDDKFILNKDIDFDDDEVSHVQI